jgi:drug/metabolite transporter (DMT)-like permease
MTYIFLALVSALLFGASTPASKLLLDNLPPFQLAGCLYLGAALGVLPAVRAGKGGVPFPLKKTCRPPGKIWPAWPGPLFSEGFWGLWLCCTGCA